jgi:hypothetical protein
VEIACGRNTPSVGCGMWWLFDRGNILGLPNVSVGELVAFHWTPFSQSSAPVFAGPGTILATVPRLLHSLYGS